jgi:hypothetical protein
VAVDQGQLAAFIAEGDQPRDETDFVEDATHGGFLLVAVKPPIHSARAELAGLHADQFFDSVADFLHVSLSGQSSEIVASSAFANFRMVVSVVSPPASTWWIQPTLRPVISATRWNVQPRALR